MIRISIQHVNKYGPLKFPAKLSQVFIAENHVPEECRKEFYQKAVDIFSKEHEDRQVTEWVKEIVGNDTMPDGAKYYGPSKEAIQKPVNEEPI